MCSSGRCNATSCAGRSSCRRGRRASRSSPSLSTPSLADVEHEPGALPLLSTALLELWQRRDGRRLRHATYELTGGVRGAVARLAEDAFGRLEPAQQGVARRCFCDWPARARAAAIVRRRVALAELEGQRRGPRRRARGAHRAPPAHDERDHGRGRARGAAARVAAPARLARGGREGRRVQRHLADAARDWEERGRDPADLYRGARLAVALEWRAAHEPELNTPNAPSSTRAGPPAGARSAACAWCSPGSRPCLALAVAGAVVALHQRSTARSPSPSRRGPAARRAGTDRAGPRPLAAARAPRRSRSTIRRRDPTQPPRRTASQPGGDRGHARPGNPLDAIDLSPMGAPWRGDAQRDRRVHRHPKPTATRARAQGDRRQPSRAFQPRRPPSVGYKRGRNRTARHAHTPRRRSFAAAGPGGAAHRDAAAVASRYRTSTSPGLHVLARSSRSDQDRRYAVRWDARTGRVGQPARPRPRPAGGALWSRVLRRGQSDS